MFCKLNFIFFFFVLFQFTASASVKHQNFSGESHEPSQSVDQTFNINNWGLGKIERNLLMDIKDKIDSLSAKCKVNVSACPKGWVPFGKSCYLVINIRTLKWSDARRTCQNLGGDLAVVKTSAENKFIYALMKKQKTVTNWGLWLGLYQKADDKYYWIDGTPLAGRYSKWLSGEPNHPGKERCINMYGTVGHGNWNDLSCEVKTHYFQYAPSTLCQKVR